MSKGSGKVTKAVWVEFHIECGRCEESATTKLGDINSHEKAIKYFKGRGWKARKGVWVCPACLRNEAIGKEQVAVRLAKAAQKAVDYLSAEACKEKDASMRAVTRRDAADFRKIRDFAKEGDLPAAARHYRDMDTAARDYLECDDEVLDALGFERIRGRK